MIAQPLVQDHVPRCRQSVDRLLHRDRFFKNKRRAFGLKVLPAAGAADDDERYGISNGAVLQSFQETGGAAKIAVDDERIDLRLGQLGTGAFRLRLHIDSDVQTAENAFQHADFLKIARDHQR